jgi:hypothetical protein
VTTDSSGNFVTNLIIPPGRKVDFLGAGTYWIGVDAVQGGGAEAKADFKVPGTLTLTRTSYNGMSLVWFSGSNFVPYRLDDGMQSSGSVWIDVNGDFRWRTDSNVSEGEPRISVWVLPNGVLSTCPGPNYCGNAYIVDTTGSFYGFNVRADVDLVGDYNRNALEKVEASTFLPGVCPPKTTLFNCLK